MQQSAEGKIVFALFNLLCEMPAGGPAEKGSNFCPIPQKRRVLDNCIKLRNAFYQFCYSQNDCASAMRLNCYFRFLVRWVDNDRNLNQNPEPTGTSRNPKIPAYSGQNKHALKIGTWTRVLVLPEFRLVPVSPVHDRCYLGILYPDVT
jgi:hypothetical protein